MTLVDVVNDNAVSAVQYARGTFPTWNSIDVTNEKFILAI